MWSSICHRHPVIRAPTHVDPQPHHAFTTLARPPRDDERRKPIRKQNKCATVFAASSPASSPSVIRDAAAVVKHNTTPTWHANIAIGSHWRLHCPSTLGCQFPADLPRCTGSNRFPSIVAVYITTNNPAASRQSSQSASYRIDRGRPALASTNAPGATVSFVPRPHEPSALTSPKLRHHLNGQALPLLDQRRPSGFPLSLCRRLLYTIARWLSSPFRPDCICYLISRAAHHPTE